MMNCILTYLKRITFWATVGLIPFFASIHIAVASDADVCRISRDSSGRNLKKAQSVSAQCLKNQAAAGGCINVVPTDGANRVSDDIHYRGVHPVKGTPQNHNGIDYAADMGATVRAAADGTIAHVGVNPGGYGNYIVIKHERKDKPGQYYTTLYAHLSKMYFSSGSVGSKVTKDTPIGEVGNTGASTGAHLHFEMREGTGWGVTGGAVINPICSEIQALCGDTKVNPMQCTLECQQNPNSEACKTPFNLTFNWVQDMPKNTWEPVSLAPTPVVESNAYNLGQSTGKCNIDSYRNSFSSCIFCDLFRVLFDTASNLAKKAYLSLSDAMINLVVIGMALWLAMTILKFVSAFDVKEPRILIKTIFNQAFVVFVVVVILRSDIQEFINLIVTPVFNTGMTLAQLVTSGQDGQTCTGFTQVTEDGGIPSSMGNNILCTIQSIQGKLLDIMTLGSTSFCIAIFEQSYTIGGIHIWILPHVGYLLVGIILWLSAFMLMVIYPWLLIDSILQLSVASALIPVAIAAYAFPITRKKYVTKVWETFMTAMFTFLFLSIVIFIITTGMEQTINKIMTPELKHAGTQGSSWNIILDPLKGVAWWSVTTLEMVFWMLLGWAVLDQAKEFAKSFSKGGFSIKPIGSPFGGMVNNVATQAALGAGKKVWGGTKWAGKQMGQGLHDMAHSAKVNRMANRAMNSDDAKTNEDGSVTATVRNWYGRKTTRTVSRDASGNLAVTNQRSRIKMLGRLSHDRTTTTDKYMTVKSKYGKDGKLLQQTIKIDSAACRNMTNRDGSLNMVAVNTLQQNSTLGQDMVNTAILQQALKERMPNSELADMDTSFAAREIVRGDDGSFTIKQTNADGTTTNFSMNISNGRIMTSVERISKSGSAVKYSSDGIINKRSTYTYTDGKIDTATVKNKYAFADYYTKYDSKPMDSNGHLSASIPQDKIMFEQDDLDLMAEQIAVYGQPNSMKEFSK